MKALISLLLLMAFQPGYPQSVVIRAAHSMLPSDQIGLVYEHWTNGAVNLSVGGYYEQSLKYHLRYSAVGVTLMAEVASNREGYTAGVFGLCGGLGAVWSIENEPWLYANWSVRQRMNYGLVGEVAGEWFMTEDFSLRLHMQQQLLFRPQLGRYRFLIGLGLVYRFKNF